MGYNYKHIVYLILTWYRNGRNQLSSSLYEILILMSIISVEDETPIQQKENFAQNPKRARVEQRQSTRESKNVCDEIGTL